MKLISFFKNGNQRFGFTLIELLATLTIMAIIGAVLFPFIGNYTAKANKDTNTRSLRIFQDAMDRYRAVNDDFTQWPIGGGTSGTGAFSDYTVISDSGDTEDIIDDLVAPGPYQTLRVPEGSITSQNVIIVSGGTNIDTYLWQVMRYRKKSDGDGVNTKGDTVRATNFMSVESSDVNDAFSN